MKWEKAEDIQKELKKILKILDLKHISSERLFCYRSYGATTRAYARIWSMPKIFQDALGIEPAYVIEVVAKKYDKLDSEQKTQVLIHELLHIPKNFSGSLLPHRGRGRNLEQMVKILYKEYKEKQK